MSKYLLKHVPDPANRYDNTSVEMTVECDEMSELVECFKRFLMSVGFPVKQSENFELIDEDDKQLIDDYKVTREDLLEWIGYDWDDYSRINKLLPGDELKQRIKNFLDIRLDVEEMQQDAQSETPVELTKEHVQVGWLLKHVNSNMIFTIVNENACKGVHDYSIADLCKQFRTMEQLRKVFEVIQDCKLEKMLQVGTQYYNKTIQNSVTHEIVDYDEILVICETHDNSFYKFSQIYDILPF